MAELERMLGDRDPIVQAQGAYGLHLQGKNALPALPALIEALKCPDSRVRQYATLAIGHIGPEARSALSPLMTALTDEDWPVRRQAALALAELGNDARPALAPLEQLTQDENPQVRKAARQAIEGIKTSSHH